MSPQAMPDLVTSPQSLPPSSSATRRSSLEAAATLRLAMRMSSQLDALISQLQRQAEAPCSPRESSRVQEQELGSGPSNISSSNNNKAWGGGGAASEGQGVRLRVDIERANGAARASSSATEQIST
jgi:hypothetical protein